MKVTKIKKGLYAFDGIDLMTGKRITGHIEYQPYDLPKSRAWQVVFGLDEALADRPYFGPSAKACLRWLQYRD